LFVGEFYTRVFPAVTFFVDRGRRELARNEHANSDSSAISYRIPVSKESFVQ